MNSTARETQRERHRHAQDQEEEERAERHMAATAGVSATLVIERQHEFRAHGPPQGRGCPSCGRRRMQFAFGRVFIRRCPWPDRAAAAPSPAPGPKPMRMSSRMRSPPNSSQVIPVSGHAMKRKVIGPFRPFLQPNDTNRKPYQTNTSANTRTNTVETTRGKATWHAAHSAHTSHSKWDASRTPIIAPSITIQMKKKRASIGPAVRKKAGVARDRPGSSQARSGSPRSRPRSA